MIADERDHRLNGQSNFPCPAAECLSLGDWGAKYADALRRIWLACRTSRFSLLSSATWGAGQPTFVAIDWQAVHRQE